MKKFLVWLDNITTPICDSCGKRTRNRYCVEDYIESGHYCCKECRDRYYQELLQNYEPKGPMDWYDRGA